MSRKRVVIYEVQCDRPDCLHRIRSQNSLIDALELAAFAGWELGRETGQPDYCGQHSTLKPGIRSTYFEE